MKRQAGEKRIYGLIVGLSIAPNSVEIATMVHTRQTIETQKEII